MTRDRTTAAEQNHRLLLSIAATVRASIVGATRAQTTPQPKPFGLRILLLARGASAASNQAVGLKNPVWATFATASQRIGGDFMRCVAHAVAFRRLVDLDRVTAGKRTLEFTSFMQEEAKKWKGIVSTASGAVID